MLSYSVNGNGFPVVFLHGFCEDKTIWSKIVEGLNTIEVQSICFDLPGHGDSGKINCFLSIDEMAKWVIDALNELNIDQFLLVGHSLGGYVSLSLCEKYPERIKGLLMFHSTAYSDSEEKKKNREKVIDFVNTNGVELFVETLIPTLFFEDNLTKNKEEVNELITIASKTDKLGLINTVKAMRDRGDKVELLQKFNFPVFYIIGKKDKAVPFESSLTQHHLPKISSSLILEKTGHMGMVEDPDKCMDYLIFYISFCLKHVN